MSASSAMARMSAAAMTAARFPRSRRQASLHCPRASARVGESSATAVSLIAYPRIEPSVEQIGGEVAQERECSVDDDHAHDERVVTIDRTFDQIASRAGQAEVT